MCALMPCSKGLTSFHRFPFPSNDPTTFQGLYNHWYTTKIYAIYIITSHGYFDNEYSIVLYLGSKKNLQLTKKCFSRNVTCDQSQWKVTTIVGKPPFNETQVVYLWNNLDIHLATVYLLQLFSLVQIDMHKNFLFVYRPLFFVSSWRTIKQNKFNVVLDITVGWALNFCSLMNSNMAWSGKESTFSVAW